MKPSTRRMWCVRLTAGLLMIASSPALAQDRVVQALAPSQGSGQVFPVGPTKLMILASFSGILYVRGQDGFLDALPMLCPAVQVLDTTLKRGEATGHCIFTGPGDDVIYSDWTCAGVPGACEGEFTLTGGTGRFQGISGGGKLVVRAALAETAASLSDGGVVRNSAGLALWPALRYRIPGQ